MIQLIFLLLLIISFLGIIYFIWIKIPVLAELPIRERKKRKIQIKNPFLSFSLEKYLHKILSNARILILKIERKISHWLQDLRAKNKKEKKDNYWQELKK